MTFALNSLFAQYGGGGGGGNSGTYWVIVALIALVAVAVVVWLIRRLVTHRRSQAGRAAEPQVSDRMT